MDIRNSETRSTTSTKSRSRVNQALGSHRQLLVQCTLSNEYGLSSVRFIEHTLYSLWQHLVTTRHQLSIGTPNTCLWVPDADINTTRLFGAEGRIAAVTRIQLQTYNPADGITSYQQRFTANEQLEIVLPILQKHWSQNRANQYLQLEPGYVYSHQHSQRVA